ncbi:MAG: methyl-viologen-reducing hydrogenase subunit delta [Acidobacteria bacterium RBG_13_68_16]|nr:MAG: methyl-viologen-reducing hydrogenase subunit delta [Acidobacteria bacterium RBG_13_68_16]
MCNACGDCAKVCPVVRPDEFQMGLSSRKAIYIQFPQAVPCSYILNMDDCLGNNPIACGKCADACDKRAINYDDRDQIITREVGAVVVAIGLDVYDPTELDEYGYTRFENVISSMEFERLICAGGPTGGHFVRPSDQERPTRIGFIQCVGSRNPKVGRPYCSNICCMNTIKDTLLLADHYPDVANVVFYQDIRAVGKSFEDMFQRSKEAGTRYVRGLPGEIEEDPETRNLVVTVENTTSGKLERHELEMVVLSVGVQPAKDMSRIASMLTLSRTSDGFFMESHPKLKPVDAPTRGVFLAGFCESPKDIKDSVCQAGAAASRAGALLNAGQITIEAITSRVDEVACTRCGVCAKVCPYGAIVWKKGEVASVVEAACAGCGSCSASCQFGAITMRHFTDEQILAQVHAVLAEDPQDKVFAFACNWCSYAGGDMAGISRMTYPASNRVVRTMCSARVSEEMVLEAFRCGAPVVLVSGCHFADCHYINANRQTVQRVHKLWDKLEKAGVRPERLQLEWISAAEGQKFAKVMRQLEELRGTVTRDEIEHAREALKAKPGKRPGVRAAEPVVEAPAAQT